MKDQLTYEETINQMTKYLLQSNVTFKKYENTNFSGTSFSIFYNGKRNKKAFVVLDESYHFITLVFTPELETYHLSDIDLFVKVSQAKKEYEDTKVVRQQKKNFKLLKLLTGE